MHTRREFLIGAAAVAASPLLARASADEPLISRTDLEFLRELAKATIASATKQDSVAAVGFPVVTPGGAYPAFWVRDFSMAAGCGLFDPKTILNHLRLVATTRNGPNERKLGDHAVIPAHAVPDHIDYDGKPVFYPGTYSSGDDQGGEPWGVLPPVDDHYEIIHLAHLLWKGSRNRGFLDEAVKGRTLFNHLRLALECPATDAETGLVVTAAETRAVGFGFCDGIYFTGNLLFASLLRWRALGEMIELAHANSMTMDIHVWQAQRKLIAKSLAQTFEAGGWLKAATGVGQQPDVWGTIYALYLGVVEGQTRDTLRRTLAGAVRDGKIIYKGGVRHVPTDHDFSPTSAWEKTAGEPKNRYQNGAYWHVPSGWLARVLGEFDKPLARQVVRGMVAHFREEDFRKGPGFGAPWECLHPEGNYRQNPVYMASVTLPLEALSGADF